MKTKIKFIYIIIGYIFLIASILGGASFAYSKNTDTLSPQTVIDSSEFALNFTSPVEESQLMVQKNTNRFRGIHKYDEFIKNAKLNFRISKYIKELTEKVTVTWVDIGCGFGVALNEAKLTWGSKINPIGVDLVNWQSKAVDYNHKEVKALFQYDGSELATRLLNERNYTFIQSDIAKLQLSEQAHLVTCFGVLQYTNDPIQNFISLFNKLAPQGVLIAHILLPSKEKDLLEFYNKAIKLLSDNGVEAQMSSYYVDNLEVNDIILIAKRNLDETISLRTKINHVENETIINKSRKKTFDIKVVKYTLELPELVISSQASNFRANQYFPILFFHDLVRESI